MISVCDTVAERVALGEPLGTLADHAASCPRCRRLAALPTELAAMRRDADPGLGFSARITAGAQQRLVARRRQRVVAGMAGVVCVAAATVFVVTRQPDDSPVAATTPPPAPALAVPSSSQHDPWKDGQQDGIDPDVRALVHFAHVERASHVSARWSRIEKPLAPYRALLKGVEP